MNVRNPDITDPCGHLKIAAGYPFNANISRTY
jgi:hypothetical protein